MKYIMYIYKKYLLMKSKKFEVRNFFFTLTPSLKANKLSLRFLIPHYFSLVFHIFTEIDSMYISKNFMNCNGLSILGSQKKNINKIHIKYSIS